MNSTALKQLLREADIEGLIADGAPADEYDSEADIVMSALTQSTGRTVSDVVSLLAAAWTRSFALDEAALQLRLPQLQNVAARLLADS